MPNKSLIFFFLCASLTTSLCAQTKLEDLLGGSPSSSNSSHLLVFKSDLGEWRRSAVNTSGGLDCAVNYSSASGGIVLIGPTPDGSKGTMLFIGTKLPAVKSTTEVAVALLTDQDPPGRAAQSIKAFQLEGEKAGVAIATDMAATLRAMTDVKRVSLKHKDSVVFEVAMDGMFPARDALAKCMGMPPITKAR
jgi:hypothetical protein